MSEKKTGCMIHRARCMECQTFTLCIKDQDAGLDYLCRKCYGGLSMLEVIERFKDIFRMIGNPGYKPNWLGPLEERYKVPF